jgi:HSP20 family protein
MATVFVWEPFGRLAVRNNRRNRAAGTNAAARSNPARVTVPFNIAEDAEAYLVEAALPGINPNELEISLDEQELTVRGAFQAPELPEGARYHRREQAVGSFERSFRFPLAINGDSVQASYEHGILTLRLPKAEAAKPRRIEVQTPTNVLEG